MSFCEVWKAFKYPAYHWTFGWHKLNGKIYHDALLCVPAGVTESILQEQHATTGHCGIEAVFIEVRRRFEFESGTQIRNIITRIRKDCHTCQSSEVPTVDMASPRHLNPVTEGFMSSLALDIF